MAFSGWDVVLRDWVTMALTTSATSRKPRHSLSVVEAAVGSPSPWGGWEIRTTGEEVILAAARVCRTWARLKVSWTATTREAFVTELEAIRLSTYGDIYRVGGGRGWGVGVGGDEGCKGSWHGVCVCSERYLVSRI